jgi:membrane fusion protein (multidrug efflux system)
MGEAIERAAGDGEPATRPSPPPPAPPRRTRRTGRQAYLVLFVLAALVVGVYFYMDYANRNHEHTDDAQVDADVVSIAPRVAGVVLTVAVVDNQSVHAGDPILELDPADFEARLRAAEADLAAAQAGLAAAQSQVAVVEANATGQLSGANAQLSGSNLSVRVAQAQVSAARAELERTRAQATNAQSQLERAQGMHDRGLMPGADLDAAQTAYNVAQAAVDEADARLSVARQQLSYTPVVAPADGMLSRLAVHPGQFVQPGQPAVVLVPNATYVVGNFKETQIGRMQTGQRAEVEVDAYPGRTFQARVASLAAGTGARFSLLPPDNASGNFVKVVQRVPVRLEWVDLPDDVVMRAGLSAYVTVYLP